MKFVRFIQPSIYLEQHVEAVDGRAVPVRQFRVPLDRCPHHAFLNLLMSQT